MTDPPHGSDMRAKADAIRTSLHSELTVPKLKILLRHVGLTQSGVKAVLIERLLYYLQQLEKTNKFEGIQELYDEVRNVKLYDGVNLPSGPNPADRTSRQSYTQMVNNLTTVFSMPSDFSRQSTPPLLSRGPSPSSYGTQPLAPYQNKPTTMDGLTLKPQNLLFEPNAFYSIKSQICRPTVISGPYARENETRKLHFRIPAEVVASLRSKRYLVGLVCQQYFAPLGQQPIQFPFNCNIKADDHSVSANTRGIKNHPGSTAPVDLTPYVFGRSTVEATHLVEVTMHINLQDPRKDDNTMSKAYAFAVVLVEVYTQEELEKALVNRPHISAEVTKEQIRFSHEPDEDNEILMSTDSVHSLKDPVMYTRINTPIRSLRCSHVDCFDAAVYIELQRQATTWKCPICNKKISWDSLAVDDYFAEILKTADQDVDQVNVMPDGTWNVRSRDMPDDDSDSDDERASKKPKKVIEVIDLVSDDEEFEPAQPTTSLPVTPTPQQPPQNAVSNTADLGSSSEATVSNPGSHPAEIRSVAQETAPAIRPSSHPSPGVFQRAEGANSIYSRTSLPLTGDASSPASRSSSPRPNWPSFGNGEAAASGSSAAQASNGVLGRELSALQREALAQVLDDDTDDEIPVRLSPRSEREHVLAASRTLSTRVVGSDSEDEQPSPSSAVSHPANPVNTSHVNLEPGVTSTSALLSQIRREPCKTAPLVPEVRRSSDTVVGSATNNLKPAIRPRAVSMLFTSAPKPSSVGKTSEQSAESSPNTSPSDDYAASRQQLDGSCMSHMQRRGTRHIEVIDLIGDD